MTQPPDMLTRLGLNEQVEQEFDDARERLGVHSGADSVARDIESADDTLRLGRIVRLDRGYPLVATASGERRAQAATELIKTADTLGVIGDWVVMRDDPDHEMGVIEAILPRRGALVRKDPGEQTSSQTIAANIDVVFVVQSLSGRGVNARRLEREMVMAYESGAKPVIVLTKADLASETEGIDAQIERAQDTAPGIEVLAVSRQDPQGIQLLLRHIPPGDTAVLIGESGVGKSTLINALLGEDILETGSVREGDDRGRHTTVAREMIVLPNDGVIIDSPGIRSIALWADGNGIDQVFSEISSRAGECKFRDCTHTTEPQCAIRRALDSGEITAERYAAYQELVDELAGVQKKREDKERSMRDIAIQSRKNQKQKYDKKRSERDGAIQLRKIQKSKYGRNEHER